MNELDLFTAALAVPNSAERKAFLDRECAGNLALRERLAKLVAAHLQSHPLLDHPPAEAAIAHTVEANQSDRDASVGKLIAGRYKLLEEIGEGGMGTVWVAEQTEPVRRKVALKLIKAGMDSRSVLARFEAERQALAVMDHPNIAKVLDGGLTDTGRPYFVMEYVKGVPITEYCDATRLSVQQRLNLFVQVCQAVQHAHQKGIIHRDLKPSNILVAPYDDKPVPKVIDFGLAKAMHQSLTERTLHTAHETVLGTPLYMSPEQAQLNNLDVDTRSDIYSLGVLLYELLTGTTPLEKQRFKEAAWDEVKRIIREEEAPRPSTRLTSSNTLASLAAGRQIEPARLTKLVRGELDWIVMKSLEKDRSRRYDTANGFAADVQRYLAGEPVLAAPPSASYRLRKFARKHRAGLTTAAAIGLLLVAGVAVSTWQAVRATNAEAAARVAEQDALQAQRAETERAEGERLAKLDAVARRAEAERQKTRAEKAQQAEAERAEGERLAKLDAQEKRTFAVAAAEKERQAKEEAVRNLAFARKGNAILGSVFAGLDPKKIAESGRPLQDVLRENLVKAVKELDGSAIGDPLEVATMQNTLGLSLLGLGESGQAIEVFAKARDTCKAKLGPDHPDTLTSMNNLALAYRDAGKLDLALPLHEETLKLRKAKLGPEHPNTLISMNSLALAYRDAGKLDLALPLHEETLKLTRAKLGPEHPDTLISMNNLALTYQAAGKLDLAVPLFEETLKLEKAKLGPEHPGTLTGMNNLAAAYQAAGKRDLALPLNEETLKLLKAKLGPEHPETLASMNNLAAAYQAAGKLDPALSLFEETLKLIKAKLGPEHPNTLVSMNNLAAAYQTAGKRDLALPLFEETLKLQKAKLGPEHPDTLRSMGNLAMAYRDARKLDLALPLFEETLKLCKAKLGPEHPSTLTNMNNLAMGYKAAGQVDLALPLFEETLKLSKAKLGPEHPDTLTGMNNLAAAYQAAGKLDLALPLYEETLKLRKAKLGPEHPDTLGSMGNLAAVYDEVKQFDKAELLHRERLPLVKQKSGGDSPAYAGALALLGLNLLHQKKGTDAEPLLRESLAIREKMQPDVWTTFNTKSLLGGALLGQKKYAEAEPLLLAGYDGIKEREAMIPEQGKVRLPEALDRLTQLYGETDKPDEVKKWQAERAKYPQPASPQESK